MNALEAIDVIESWKRVLIEGKPEQIERLLQDIETRLLRKGWCRDQAGEAKMARSPTQRERLRCFQSGANHGPRVLLCLNQVSERRIRGGRYSLIDGGANEPTEVADTVADVIKSVLTPSASALGLKVTVPRLGRASQVPPRTLAALYMFSDSWAGTWPLSAEAEQSWRQFIITASHDDTAFDPDELMDWFVSNGWSSEAARALTDRFINEAALLADYEEDKGT
jgi:hypothetical protein